MSTDLIARLRKTRWRDDANRLRGQYDTNGVEPERLEAAIAIERLLAANHVTQRAYDATRAEIDRLSAENATLRRLVAPEIAHPIGGPAPEGTTDDA